MVAASRVESLPVGRFHVEAELARGGMGTVYAAFDESTGRRVALKRLSRSAPSQMAALFEREFYVLSSLKHPRIIDVYDFGIDGEGPYYTMELLEGSDLRELSPVAPQLACRYLRDVASSLALLHARRILHRDVSPRNVRTLPDGSCKLIDFGALASFGTSDDIVGTPPAIPPESLTRLPLDQRADLFSLGALAYYLLTGRHAYPARKVNELPALWLERPLPPSAFADTVPPELDELVLALLSVDSLARPASAAEVIDRLNVIGSLEAEADGRAAQSYFVGATLIERKKELDRVERRIARARRGRGDAVFIDADAGVGKSRFLAEVALKAQLTGTTVLRADAAALVEPLSTGRALVQQLARVLPRLASKAIEPHAALFRAVWPDLLDDLGLTKSDVEPNTDTPNPSRAAAALPSAIVDCLTQVSQREAVVVAVDNVDRADAESAALLMALARLSRKERIVVVTTASIRHESELSAAIRGIRDAGTNIRLRELSEDGTHELVRAAFGDVPHVHRTATRLHGVTSGNPEHCMTLLRAWVARGLIHYTDGGWTLPIEVPRDALVGVERVVKARLDHCSGAARRVAAILAVVGGVAGAPASLELCVSTLGGELSSRDVIAGLAELVEAELVSQTSKGYVFGSDSLRASVLESVDALQRSRLHVLVAEFLLLTPGLTPQLQMVAGHHLIRGQQGHRGADLIARTARAAAADDRDASRFLSKHAAALEAALEVFRGAGRSNVEMLELLVPLCVASYEISYAFGMRYAEETFERLERALGLPSSAQTAHDLPLETLLPILGGAPVLDPGEERTERTPDVVQLVTWLIQTAMTLTAVASAAIDLESEERFARSLRPFIAFGPNHPASAAHDYCCGIVAMAKDRFTDAHALWTRMLARIGETHFPPVVQRRLRVAALYCLGILECNRDDDSGLARIEQVEAVNSSQATVMANQLRFLYHGFRGDMESANRARDAVEAYAVQYGSAWQVEIWSTSTLCAVYGNARDSAGNKRVVEQLERIKKAAPSMEMYWQRAMGTQYMLTGAYRKAIEVCERSLQHSNSNRVGTSAVRAVMARCHNELGDYATAKRLCDEAIAHCEVDRDYTALTLFPYTERAKALAGLRDFEAARAEIANLVAHHEKNGNPATMGSIHRAGAEIARQEGDSKGFETHLARMESWFRPTKNPALIAQCDKLKNAATAGGGWKSVRSASGTFGITQMTFAQSVLATCEGGDARKQRALELVAAQAATPEAWLFTLGPGEEPLVVARLGIQDAPVELYDQVGALFAEEEDDEDEDETAFVQSASTIQTALSPLPPQNFRVLGLVVNQGSKGHLLVGAIALPANRLVGSVNPALLKDIAAQLFQAGDVVTVRIVG